MPLNPDAKRLLGLMSAVGGNFAIRPTPAERRQAFRNLAASVAGARPAVRAVNSITISGPGGPLKLRIYMPMSVEHSLYPALIYLHGGWVTGDLDSYDTVCCHLANSAGCCVLAVDYRLAPEYKFPCALEDATAAVTWLAAHGPDLDIDADRIGIAGDSAGANLVAGVCRRMRGGAVALKLQLMLCPLLDAVGDTESRRTFSHGYFLDKAAIDDDFLHYCPVGFDYLDPRVSPARAADFSGLPPAHIHTAEFDPVRDEGRFYAEQLAAAGVPVTYHCHAGMIHHFYGMAGVISAAVAILHDAGSAIGAAFGRHTCVQLRPSEPVNSLRELSGTFTV